MSADHLIFGFISMAETDEPIPLSGPTKPRKKGSRAAAKRRLARDGALRGEEDTPLDAPSSEEDGGVAIFVSHGRVMIHLGRSTTDLVMTPAGARELAQILIKHAERADLVARR